MNIPAELVSVLHAAADAAPPHAGDLAAVRRRGRARLRHRAVAATGLVALAVVGALGAPYALAGPDPDPGPVAAPPEATGSAEPTESTNPPEPAQRLLLDGSGGVMELRDGEDGSGDQAEPPPGLTARELFEWYRDRPGASGVVGALAEVRPDGAVVEFDPVLPGIDSVQDVVAMPDGRLAMLGLVDLMPGAERTDGPCVAGIETALLVVEADGTVSGSRDLRVRCQTLDLVAADADTAYLLRGSRLVAHDLATGDEQVLLESAEAVPAERSGLAYAGGRLATVTRDDQPACGAGTIGRLVVRVAELATGATSDHRLPVDGCGVHGGPLRLSPDGRYAAYAYQWFLDEPDRQLQVRIAILDLDRGTVVEDRLVSEVTGRDQSALTGRDGVSIADAARTAAVAGLAWDDGQTLRLAWYEVPMDRVHWLSDVIEVTTISVPG